jgi:hypothetical protein
MPANFLRLEPHCLLINAAPYFFKNLSFQTSELPAIVAVVFAALVVKGPRTVINVGELIAAI